MTDTNAAATAIMRRYVCAVTRMILGKTTMAPGLAMTAGEVLNERGVLRIAELAWQSGNDLIHLDFALDGEAPILRDIIVAMPRDNACLVQRGCRLAQRAGDVHAVILPRDQVRGHFRVIRNEIMHIDRKPVSLTGEGVMFATRRLARLIRDDIDVRGQIIVTELPR